MLVEKCGKSQARPSLGFISPPPVPGQGTQEGAQRTRDKKDQEEEKEPVRLQAPWRGGQRGERKRRRWGEWSGERGRAGDAGL